MVFLHKHVIGGVKYALCSSREAYCLVYNTPLQQMLFFPKAEESVCLKASRIAHPMSSLCDNYLCASVRGLFVRHVFLRVCAPLTGNAADLLSVCSSADPELWLWHAWNAVLTLRKLLSCKDDLGYRQTFPAFDTLWNKVMCLEGPVRNKPLENAMGTVWPQCLYSWKRRLCPLNGLFWSPPMGFVQAEYRHPWNSLTWPPTILPHYLNRKALLLVIGFCPCPTNIKKGTRECFSANPMTHYKWRRWHWLWRWLFLASYFPLDKKTIAFPLKLRLQEKKTFCLILWGRCLDNYSQGLSLGMVVTLFFGRTFVPRVLKQLSFWTFSLWTGKLHYCLLYLPARERQPSYTLAEMYNLRFTSIVSLT